MENNELRCYEMFFPHDDSGAADMRQLMSDHLAVGMAGYTPDIKFASPCGHDLKLQLLRPALDWNLADRAPAPLIVFVQGSAWTNPNPYMEIPQLSMFAKAGFVVASVTHRPSGEAPFPACLIDVKSAIRFLRAHAAEYGIDPRRVAIWGTSSGGNISLLTAATEGMAEFEQGEYLDQSSAVQAVVDFFGPTDVNEMMRLAGANFEMLSQQPDSVLYTLIGGTDGDARGRMARVSPAYYIKPGVKLPPHLMVHGDCDSVVPFSQSLTYYKQLRGLGQVAHLIKVCGAEHENRFWTQNVLDEVMNFLKAYLV